MQASKNRQRRNPSWWTSDNDSAWERVKAAFRRDWEQTKNDVGAGGKDLNQDVDDTVGQMAGSRPIPPENQPNFDENEDAFRYGYAARQHYGRKYKTWDVDLENEIRRDWDEMAPEEYERRRSAIRKGWSYDDSSAAGGNRGQVR